MSPRPPLTPLLPDLLAPPALLAQGAAAAGRVMFWCAVLLVGSGLVVAVAFIVYRRLTSDDDTSEPLPMGFSLSDLRTLHARGELSDEEFEHAKRRMVAGTRARLEVEPGPDPKSTPPAGATGEPDGGIRWETPPDAASPDAGPEPEPGPGPDQAPPRSR